MNKRLAAFDTRERLLPSVNLHVSVENSDTIENLSTLRARVGRAASVGNLVALQVK
jgi:hypothetical protein